MRRIGTWIAGKWTQLMLAALLPLAVLSAALAVVSLDQPYSPVAVHVAMAALLGVGVAVGLSTRLLSQQRRWQAPLKRLEELLSQARRGEASIEELSQIRGPLSSLTAAIQDLLRELRSQKAQQAQLEQEMRQRVAQRTDALERLIGGLRQQACRDPLTGLYNRRFLDQELPSLIERSRASGGNLCLLMLDLDNFKCLNDNLGHRAGDELLRTVGQIIRSTVRSADLAFRYGGDEFVLLLPEHGAVAGEALARRLMSLVDELGRVQRTPLPLGLSAGWATLRELAEPHPEGLLAEADKRLYLSKTQRKGAA